MISFLRELLVRVRRFDWVLMGGLTVLGVAGLVTLGSLDRDLFGQQLIWYGLFVLIVVIVSQFDWRWLLVNAWFRHAFYWAAVGLTAFTLIQGEVVRGTRSWVALGGFRFEPVELMKVALIIMFAGLFSRLGGRVWFGRNIALSLFYALLPAVIVVIQPDFGSALVLIALWFGFLFMGGVHVRRAALVVLVFALSAVLVWFFVLAPYQKDRILSYVFPEQDPQGASYNVIQSKIAIGSAGWFGKGFGLGTQSHFRFLPEPETDFIFAAFVEEWGLVGGIVVLLTYAVVAFRIIRIGVHAGNNDYAFVSLGVVVVLLVHFLVNIGSTIGLTPVTGITFPFVSYGGSNLLTLAILVGIIQRIKLES
jgi:rod shape determining protein RodA